MSNNGKLGERLFKERMQNSGYSVEDVSNNPEYFPVDIDFLVTSPTSGATKSFEVKWDTLIHRTNNLYLEIENINSKQWNGEGWWKHIEADYLVYGDAANRIFYVIPLLELKERVKNIRVKIGHCGYESTGLLVSLDDISDITQIL